MSNTQKRIPSLDGLRAVSILIVLIGHLATCHRIPPKAERLILLLFNAHVGVTIFFVISGFIITTLLLNEKFSENGIDVRMFYARRALRILPACYLYILFIFVYTVLSGHWSRGYLFLHALTFTLNFASGGVWTLGHLWSLGVEEQFYTFWPWVMRLRVRSIAGAAVLMIVLAPLVRLATHWHPAWGMITLRPFLARADSLMIGCLLAVGRRAFADRWEALNWGKSPLRFLCVFIIWLVYYLGSIGKGGDLMILFGRTAQSACIAYILAGSITRTDGKLFRLLNHPLAVALGTLSYSLYIWQQFFIYFPGSGAGRLGWSREFPMDIVLIFAAAAASYYLWERRFLKLKARFQPADPR